MNIIQNTFYALKYIFTYINVFTYINGVYIFIIHEKKYDDII